jgi:hypothetical protein
LAEYQISKLPPPVVVIPLSACGSLDCGVVCGPPSARLMHPAVPTDQPSPAYLASPNEGIGADRSSALARVSRSDQPAHPWEWFEDCRLLVGAAAALAAQSRGSSDGRTATRRASNPWVAPTWAVAGGDVPALGLDAPLTAVSAVEMVAPSLRELSPAPGADSQTPVGRVSIQTGVGYVSDLAYPSHVADATTLSTWHI